MSSKGKKRKHSSSPERSFSDEPPIQKLRIKPIPEQAGRDGAASGKKHSKKKKQQVSPISTTSISPSGDGNEDGGLKMKFILSPKKEKMHSDSPSGSDTHEGDSPRGSGKVKKKKDLKAKLVFGDQVLTLDGEKVTHGELQAPGKKHKSAASSAKTKQSPEQASSAKKKKKEPEKVKVKSNPELPMFTKVPKSAEKSKIKNVKVESDSGYSDTPTTSAKSKKLKAKLQTVEEHVAPSPQASDVSRDSLPKKKKKDKEKKKKKMFKFKGDRNRFLNVRDTSDDDGDESFSRSLMDDDSLGGHYDGEESLESSTKKEKAKKSKMDRMIMPQMPVPDYSLEKQAAESRVSSVKSKAKRDERRESGIQSSRAEDLISQLTANGSEMETIYPSYMLPPDGGIAPHDVGWIKKKKKKKKLAKDKKKKKKLKVLERDDQGNVKYVIRKTKLSGYMLWCRSYRSTFVAQNPGLDFSTISRRMGALWQTLPDDEKAQWRLREITVNTKVPVGRLKNKDAVRDIPPFRLKTPEKSKTKAKKIAAATAKGKVSKKKKPIPARLASPKWQPIDCAAYLRLLGESLSDVGEKLQTHRDNIEVHGSVSVLLDSMLCALGPLMCLTDQVPELNAISKRTKISFDEGDSNNEYQDEN
ncbi:uncharacterized protein [Diadema antillarum]|uniref:uncharacterized protein n=1 Tax=Diadema antillarum TaxID=105358 RepID=UPI003A88D726